MFQKHRSPIKDISFTSTAVFNIDFAFRAIYYLKKNVLQASVLADNLKKHSSPIKDIAFIFVERFNIDFALRATCYPKKKIIFQVSASVGNLKKT